MLTGSDPYNNDTRGSTDFLNKDILSSRHVGNGTEYFPGFQSEPSASGLTLGASYKGYENSFENPNLHGHRREGPGLSGPTSGPSSVRGYETPFEDPNLLVRARDGSFSGLTGGVTVRGYQASFEDPNLLGQRREVGVSIPDMGSGRPNSLRRSTGPPMEAEGAVSNVLFVDGLPTDCTRREVGHLFRPFIGFTELRLVHKEPRRRGDKAMVLCFVEFADAKCALTALEALQGYKFDDKKPDSPFLKIHFAHFPFRLPSERDGPRV
ncbi:RNA-binding protein with multiple splicing [Striga asiatica]|uniref:RNA-binding protein with multiple splicing n=1 Tax=Striga asiatica TaxID=4170 RepID=A0A5A7PRH1_STRAF|nr:RNA-binding protein with multiple splicing [Striga asiatica]